MGEVLGKTEGMRVGAKLGVIVGETVGANDGSSVALILGINVGVGEKCVGAIEAGATQAGV